MNRVEPFVRRAVQITGADVTLAGDLTLPSAARGVVLFAHGSGSSRFSTRNRFVAEVLNEARIGTLLFDLLTTAEERDREKVFDIPLLADRLALATGWVAGDPETAGLPIGYFGASTGAAAALVAAARATRPIAAVVSRGGRPDLAGEWLSKVTAPTLLIVGGRDYTVLNLNRVALEKLMCPKRLEVVPDATHLFEERGALEEVAALAASWFRERLAADLVQAPG
jgi:putative phosphoribosyl transferase